MSSSRYTEALASLSQKATRPSSPSSRNRSTSSASVAVPDVQPPIVFRRDKKAEAALERKDALKHDFAMLLISKSKTYLKATLHTLLTTGETLDDVGFSTALDVFTKLETVYMWGIAKRLVMFITFLTLFVNTFNNAYIAQKYVALDKTSGVCEVVTKTWNGKFKADYNGNWNGKAEYHPELAMYEFQIYDFSLDMTQFSEHFENIKTALKKTGDILATKDLANNILYWASWSFTQTLTNSNQRSVESTFIMTASPVSIMNNEGLQGTFASVNMDCSFLTSSQSYNSASGTFTTTAKVPELASSQSCSNVITPTLLGYDPTLNGDTLKININIITLFTALAINSKVNGEDSFNNFVTYKTIIGPANVGNLGLPKGNYPNSVAWPATGTTAPSGVDLPAQKKYVLVDRYDPQYPGMDPVACLGPEDSLDTGKNFNCFIRIGDSYGIPFLAHKGDNKSAPNTCDCANNPGTDCDKFDFLFGLVVFDHNESREYKGDGYDPSAYPDLFKPVLPLLEIFVNPPPFTAYEANLKAFRPAWSSFRGQQCTSTQCLQCGDIYATVNLPDISTTTLSSTNFVDFTDFSSLAMGMEVSGDFITPTSTPTPTPTTILSVASSLTLTGGRTTATTTPTPSPLGVITRLKFKNSGCSDDGRNSALNYGDLSKRYDYYLPFNSWHYGTRRTSKYLKTTGRYTETGNTYTITFGTPVDKNLLASGWHVDADGVTVSGVTITIPTTSFNAATEVTVSKSLTGLSASCSTSCTFQFYDPSDGGFGSLVVFNSFSALQTGVTSDNYQLTNGSCFNSISSPNFDTLKTNPFGALEEVYFQCTQNLADSILNSAGIAAGTAGLIVPTFFWAFMFVIMGWVSYQHTMSALDMELDTDIKLQSEDFDPSMSFTRPLSDDRKREMARVDLYHATGYNVEEIELGYVRP